MRALDIFIYYYNFDKKAHTLLYIHIHIHVVTSKLIYILIYKNNKCLYGYII
jgi:hypothetical protein